MHFLQLPAGAQYPLLHCVETLTREDGMLDAMAARLHSVCQRAGWYWAVRAEGHQLPAWLVLREAVPTDPDTLSSSGDISFGKVLRVLKTPYHPDNFVPPATSRSTPAVLRDRYVPCPGCAPRPAGGD